MAHPTRHITNGPSSRALELAFLARNLEAAATFTILINDQPVTVELGIFNFHFVTGHGPMYEVAGHLVRTPADVLRQLPPHSFVSVKYDAGAKSGTMAFTNGE